MSYSVNEKTLWTRNRQVGRIAGSAQTNVHRHNERAKQRYSAERCT
jgi:hypothetical protein